MTLLQSFLGMVQLEITTADIEPLLREAGAAGVEFRRMRRLDELRYSVFVSRNMLSAINRICERYGASCRLEKRVGIYWTVKKIKSRPILLIGELFLLLLTLWIPTKVYFVQIEGNSIIPQNRILSAAEECGITFGASRRSVRSERTKNALLARVPELQWAGVNTSGCTATISVREKEGIQTIQEPGEITGILADREGFILSCTVTSGNLMVSPGESVRKGQLLISPYTDCGLCIRAERAEGEIVAQTKRTQEAVLPAQKLRKGAVQCIKRKFSILTRKKRIFLWKDSGIWDGSCGRMYEEYYVTLPGGFRLPVAFCIESYEVRDLIPDDISGNEAELILKTFLDGYLQQQMVAGKILGCERKLTEEDGRYRMHADYSCVEMIGNTRKKQIGDMNGENS